MSNKTQPASGEKKEHHLTKLKREHGEQQAEIEALKAQLGAQPAVTEAAPPTIEGYDLSADPIGQFRGIDEIYLVGYESILCGHMLPTESSTKPNEFPRGLRPYADKDWSNNPFKTGGRNDEETQNLRVMLSKFHHHRVDRNYADRFWESKWSPFPKTACITPASMRGKDYQGQPKGDKTPTSGDNLIELMRWYLQRYAGQLWIDYTYHREQMNRGDCNFSCPNPYGKGRERFLVDPVTVARSHEGVLQKDWGNG